MSCCSGLQKLAYNMFCSSKPAANPHVLPRQCASSGIMTSLWMQHSCPLLRLWEHALWSTVTPVPAHASMQPASILPPRAAPCSCHRRRRSARVQEQLRSWRPQWQTPC